MTFMAGRRAWRHGDQQAGWPWYGDQLADRRARVADVALAVVATVFGIVGTRGAAEQADPSRRGLDVLAYALVVTAAAGLAARRRWPLVTLGIVGATAVAYLARGYPYGPILLFLVFATFSAALRLPVRRSLPASCALMVGAFAAHLYYLDQDRWFTDGLALTAVSSAWLLVPWAVGTVLQGRREAVMRIREEARRQTAYEQRLQIARDVHDVVGHGLAVINMQAGIALHVLEKRPEQAAVALDAIKRTSKEALEELRATLAVYRSGDPAPRRPAAGLGQLDALVAATAESGLTVDLDVTGDPVELPAAIDLAAYRIVQESLTNVLRHAGPAMATVRIRYEPGALVLDIADDGRGHGTTPPGHGIAGMRERAAALGGTLDAGPRVGGGFAVHASFPVAE